jgi:hypothetical protein
MDDDEAKENGINLADLIKIDETYEEASRMATTIWITLRRSC